MQSLLSLGPGTVLGAAVTLVGSYLVGVQRKYEMTLNKLIEEDIIAAWSNPTRQMHEAAEMVQRQFRYVSGTNSTLFRCPLTFFDAPGGEP